jgi:hypothetical protein
MLMRILSDSKQQKLRRQTLSVRCSKSAAFSVYKHPGMFSVFFQYMVGGFTEKL